MLNSYPHIYALGHKAIANLMDGPVLVQEKVDGSQFSFGVTVDGELQIRSKGATMHPDAPEAMFSEATQTAKRLAPELRAGWTYRGEYLKKPKHNSLAYDRIPKQHIILFDINNGLESYLPYLLVHAEANRLGLDVVPLLCSGKVDSIESFRAFLDRESILGGQKIEGVVVKPANYDQFGPDKKCLMGKFVSEAFKEVHAKEWKTSNPSGGDILTLLAEEYRSPARWNKAVMHLAERGELEHSPRDIGKLMKEVPSDIRQECEDEIKEKLFKWAWPHIQRRTNAGLPEWYKDELLKQQFNSEGA